MSDAKWRTLGEVAKETGAPEASISARLRDLRKEKFGGYLVERKYHGDGLWAYRVMQRVPIQLDLNEALKAALLPPPASDSEPCPECTLPRI